MTTLEMVPTIASSKVTPVEPSNAVARPRLLKLLDALEEQRVALITGFPGSGKTILAGQWSRASWDGRTAWVSLDAADNDASRYWRYVASALGGAGVRCEGNDGSLQNDLYSWLDGMLENISRLKHRVLLVLDDFHVINNEDIRGATDYFVDHLPLNARAIVTTRAGWDLTLHRQRSADCVIAIRNDDLALTLDEFRNVIATTSLANVDASVRREIFDQTEGWVAGVAIAAHGLGVGQDADWQAADCDYFVREIWPEFPSDLRGFLLDTAVLTEFNSSLGDAVSGRSDSAERIEELKANNVFMLSSEKEHWVRYHRMFRIFLMRELSRIDPIRITKLHETAGQWSEANDYPSQAVEHFMSCGNFDEAFRLIALNLGRFDNEGRLGQVAGWVREFPDRLPVVEQDSEHMLDYASMLVAIGEPNRACNWLTRAQMFPTRGSPAAASKRIARTASFCHLLLGDCEESIREGERAIDLNDERDDALARLYGALIGAYAWNRRFDDADRAFQAGLDACLGSAVHDVVLPGSFALASYEEGHLTRAHSLAEAAIASAGVLSVTRSWAVVAARLALGQVLLERNQLEDAAAAVAPLRAAFEDKRYATAAALLVHELIAEISAAGGDDDELAEIVSRARHPSAPLVGSLRDRFVRTEARMHLYAGETELARTRLQSVAPDTPTQIELARVDMALGNVESARLRVDGIHDPVITTRERLELQLLAARIEAADEPDQAKYLLRSALAIAEPEGYVRTVLTGGRELLPLIVADASRTASPYLRKLVRDSASVVTLAQLPAEDPLTERELAVLQYLSTSIPNTEIASQMYVSVNTVKTHIKNIYRKLNVGTRSEAVRQAYAMGLM